MVEECPRMKALQDFLAAGAHDSDRKWAEYVALAPDLAGFPNPKRGPAVDSSASSTTRPTASPRVVSSVAGLKRDATKDGLTPGAQHIYDFLVGSSPAPTSTVPPRDASSVVRIAGMSKRAAATPSLTTAITKDELTPGARDISDLLVGGSSAPASAVSKVSSVPQAPSKLNVVPIVVQNKVTAIAATVPTTCSSECPCDDAEASVSVDISSATPNSPTTTCELAALVVDDKALAVDVTGDTSPTAAIWLPGDLDDCTGNKDSVDMSPTPWNVHRALMVPPRNSPRPPLLLLIVPELFTWLPTTCSTDCSCGSIESSSRLLPEAYKELIIGYTVSTIAPWPPPSCTCAGASMIYGHDLCHNAQQKRGKDFLVVGVMGSPLTLSVQDVKYNQEKHSANWLEVRPNTHQVEGMEMVCLQLPWLSLLGLYLKLTTAAAKSAMVKNIHGKGHPNLYQSDWVASRCSMVVYTTRVEDVQPSVCAFMVQTHKFYSARLSSWKGVMLARYQWMLMRCKPSVCSSWEMELVLVMDWQTCDFSCAVTKGQVVQSLALSYTERYSAVKFITHNAWDMNIGWDSTNMGCNTWMQEHVPIQLLEVYNMLSRLTSNHISRELIVFKHWVIAWDPGDFLVQHLLSPMKPRALAQFDDSPGYNLMENFTSVSCEMHYSFSVAGSLLAARYWVWCMRCMQLDTDRTSRCVSNFRLKPPWSHFPPTIATSEFMRKTSIVSKSLHIIAHFTVKTMRLHPTKILCYSLLIQWCGVLISARFSFYATLQNATQILGVDIFGQDWRNSTKLPISIHFELQLFGITGWYMFSARFRTPAVYFFPVGVKHGKNKDMSSGKYPLSSVDYVQLSSLCFFHTLQCPHGLIGISSHYQCVRIFHEFDGFEGVLLGGYIMVSCLRYARNDELTQGHAADVVDALFTANETLLLPWDPGDYSASAWYQSNPGSVDDDCAYPGSDTSLLPWDPGGLSSRDRLEGKPNFKGGGLSTTRLYGLANGPSPWAMACLGARHERHIYQWSYHNETGLGTERTDGLGLEGEDRLGCGVCHLLPPDFPQSL